MDNVNGSAIGALLDRLSTWVTGEDREHLAALQSRLRERRFRVLVVGEAKRGKSTLVNALLGRVLLPTGVTPVTALPTVVRHGRPEQLHVTYHDGARSTARSVIYLSWSPRPETRTTGSNWLRSWY